MTKREIVAVALNAFGVALEPLEERHRAGLAVAGNDPLIWRFLPYDVSNNGMDRWFDTTLALQQKHVEAIWVVPANATAHGTVLLPDMLTRAPLTAPCRELPVPFRLVMLTLSMMCSGVVNRWNEV